MKKATLVLHSPIDLNYLDKNIDRINYIFAVDGGHNLLSQINIQPSLTLGDLDSASIAKKDKKLKLSNQSLNDFEKSLKYLKSLNYTDLDIFGIFHGRLDHVLNNIEITLRYQTDFKFKILDNFYTLHLLSSGENQIRTHNNRTISIFGINLKLKSSTGLKYPLKDIDINFGKSPQGLSNETTKSEVSINVSQGQGFLLEIKLPNNETN